MKYNDEERKLCKTKNEYESMSGAVGAWRLVMRKNDREISTRRTNKGEI